MATRWRGRRATAATVAGLLAAVVVALVATALPSPADAGAGNVWLTERRILNMAHGGGLHEAPEGTLYAYKTAAARGANSLEMDLHVTLDGHVVAIHDSTVDRTTDGEGCVVAHTLDELRALDAAHQFVPGEGPRSGRPDSEYTLRGIATGAVAPPAGFAAEDFRIATLEEIFEAVPDASMIMELKPTEVYQSHDCPAFVAGLPPDQRPDLPAAVAELIDRYGMADKVMVASFIDDLMSRFKALAPDVATSFPVGESLAVYNAFLAGDPLPNPNGHDAFQVPRAYGPIVITREIVEYAQANGVAVHFWTINDPAEMEELLDWGVDGLITDEPQVLAQVLEERGEPQPAVPSTTGLTAEPAGTSAVGEPVTFAASVGSGWPSPAVSGEVELWSDDEVVARADVADGTALFEVSDLAFGPHTLRATYTGSNRVLASSSEPLSHEVTPGEPPTAPPPTAPPSTTGSTADAVVANESVTSGGTGGTLPATGGGLSALGLGLALVAAGVACTTVARLARRRTG